MSKIKTLIGLLKNRQNLIVPLGANGFFRWMTDEQYLSLLYKSVMHKELDLKNPHTFNEKLQWLKIHDKNPRYTSLVDKISAKEIVGDIIGNEHIVKTYATWEKAEEIDFSVLPDKVVLKCNHDQGSVMLIPDTKKVNKQEVINTFRKCLHYSPFDGTREHAYKGIIPKVFAEEFLEEEIIDYKFYCFNGEPKFLYCGKGLTADHSLKIDFFDMDWKLMPFYRTDYHRLGMIEKPTQFELMKDIARKLSDGVTFVRIDLFEVKGNVFFSEFTLCPASGLMPFEPEEYDSIVGDWLEL